MPDEDQEDQGIKVVPKEVFTRDPVMFEALMGFQYGDGEEFDTSQAVLAAGSIGVSCQVEELRAVLPDFDFWLSLEKGDREPRRFRLYLNDQPESLSGAKLLLDFGWEFETRYLDVSRLKLFRMNCNFPVLVDLEFGVAESSLSGLKRSVRGLAIESYYLDDNLSGTYCFNEKGAETFSGKLEEAPYPVSELFSEHPYVESHRLRSYGCVVVWDLGEWEVLSRQVNRKGHLVQEAPPVVLFADEVRALREGAVAVDCPYYDRYCLRDGRLYRVYVNKR